MVTGVGYAFKKFLNKLYNGRNSLEINEYHKAMTQVIDLVVFPTIFKQLPK